MSLRRVNSRRRQRGLAAVEAVIVLPLLLFLALAIGEFGHMLMLYTTLNKAQQDGARYLAKVAILGDTGNICLGDHDADPEPLCDGVSGNVEETKNLIIYGDINSSGSPLLPVDTVGLPEVLINEPVDGFVRIQVTYNFKPVFGDVLSTFGFGDELTLTFPLVSTITMRAL